MKSKLGIYYILELQSLINFMTKHTEIELLLDYNECRITMNVVSLLQFQDH